MSGEFSSHTETVTVSPAAYSEAKVDRINCGAFFDDCELMFPSVIAGLSELSAEETFSPLLSVTSGTALFVSSSLPPLHAENAVQLKTVSAAKSMHMSFFIFFIVKATY